MKKKEIYLILRGRIGNQLFMYAFAREIQKQLDDEAEIIIDDREVLDLNWENSLMNYDLKNVRYVHDNSELKHFKWKIRFFILNTVSKICNFKASYNQKKKREDFFKPFMNLFGILLCENGYSYFNLKGNNTYLLFGYFQSEKYFPNVKDELISVFSFSCNGNQCYPDSEILRNANSVCISIKVEHNIGSSLYAVCGKKYWEEAISYILSKVENPVFFICSDDVEFVKNNLIDCTRYKVIFQDKKQPVYKTLAEMSLCKHFIIGNTTFGWWAQYMCMNPAKITVAPSKWMLVDMPIDIYQKDWHLIDVEKHLDLGDSN